MEIITLIIMAGVIGFVVSLGKSSSTSNRPIVKNKQKDDDPLGSTVSKAGFGVGTLFILDEIIDGKSNSVNTSQPKPEPEYDYDVDALCEDCECDDFEFFK